MYACFVPPYFNQHSQPRSRQPVVGGAASWIAFSAIRSNVLVELEQVGGVVLVLQRNQALVVGAVGRAHPLLSFVAQEVDVGPMRVGLQGGEQTPRPVDMPFVVSWCRPGAEDIDYEPA